MRFPSLSAGAAALPLLLLFGAGCEISDFLHSKDDLDSKSFEATLSGKNEVPSADLNGMGRALLKLNPVEEMLCFQVQVRNLEPVTVAHIHEAPAGVNGPIVVDFQVQAGARESCKEKQRDTPSLDSDAGVPSCEVHTQALTGCVAVEEDLLNAILAEPAQYYVNVHTAEFPAGAVRGQLEHDDAHDDSRDDW